VPHGTEKDNTRSVLEVMYRIPPILNERGRKVSAGDLSTWGSSSKSQGFQLFALREGIGPVAG